MRVFVTGGTGFLGRHVVWRLASEGADVVFCGRNQAHADIVIANAPARVSFGAIEHGSPGALELMRRYAERCDAIVHCAALSSPWGRRVDFDHANVQSTREVLAASRDVGVGRLVHISTPGLYFQYRHAFNIVEVDPLPPPVNEYVATKRRAEELVREAAGVSSVILRPRAIFGPWDATLMPRLERAFQRGPIPLLHGGAAMLDLTYIDNAVDAVWLAMTRPLRASGVAYNISNGEPISVIDLLHEVSRVLEVPLRVRRLPYPMVGLLARLAEFRAKMFRGSEPLLTRYTAGLLAFSQTLCLDAARKDLHYEPRIPLREGFERYARWRKQGSSE